MNKIIYLDWNIFQDIFQKRQVEELAQNVDAARRQGYRVVYSGAHMRDLSRCSSPEYVKRDIAGVSAITENWCVHLQQDHNGLACTQAHPDRVLGEVREQQKNDGAANLEARVFFQPYCVDMSQLSDKNIFTPYLKRSGGIMSSEILEQLISNLYPDMFSDHKLQKKFRDSFSELAGLKNPVLTALMNMPIFTRLFDSKEQISENLLAIVDSHLSISGKTINAVPLAEKITTTYNLLDFFPVFSERLQKRNNINNIATDAEHVLFASGASHFICGDEKLVEKAKIIFRAYGIRTKVYDRPSFVHRVTFV